MPGGRRLARGQASEHGTFWPLGPQRAKPIERHGYTNDMVMAKGESLDMTSRNSPVVQDAEPKRQIY